jgi:hypothetical protein
VRHDAEKEDWQSQLENLLSMVAVILTINRRREAMYGGIFGMKMMYVHGIDIFARQALPNGPPLVYTNATI